MADSSDSTLASGFRLVVYMEELKSEDIQIRMAAVHRLTEIASLIGCVSTRSELIPFLTDNLCEEDEILVALAEQLGEFGQCVGGIEYAHCLLPPLENLALIDEAAVRNKATDSILKIINPFTPKDIKDYVVPMVIRLSQGEWFASRSSACNLFAAAYACDDESLRVLLRGYFVKLCKDETPMVRRAAASKIGEFCAVMTEEVVRKEMIPVLIDIMNDTMDSVRLLAVESCIYTLLYFSPELMINSEIFDVLKATFDDPSWRVRYVLATKITDLQVAFGDENSITYLVPFYEKLLGDVEKEVRVASASRIKDFLEYLPSDKRPDVFTKIICPKIDELIKDSVVEVKSAVASIIMPLSEVIEEEIFIDKLIPHLNTVLEDENSDVRLSALANVNCIHAITSVDCLLQKILPAIISLASDVKWRVRYGVIELMPLIACQLGLEFFDQQLSDLCFKWLDDNVFAVREAAVLNIGILTLHFGESWAEVNIFPKLEGLIADKNYLRRLTIISLLERLLKCTLREDLREMIISTILAMAKDTVANVRFNVAKALRNFWTGCANLRTSSIENKIKACLETLLIDKDDDVKYFAGEALSALDQIIQA